MNLRDLHYLSCLAETRHFGRAADMAHVSQPTLSAQIRKLEEELGVELVERDSRNVALTQAGEAVLLEARAALAHAETIRDIARSYTDPLAGSLSLGIIASLGPFLAPGLLQDMADAAPRLTITLREGLTAELLEALRAHKIDAALLATPPDGTDLAEQALFDEPFLLAHASSHPLATVSAPTPAMLEQGTLLLLSEGHCLRDQALALCNAASTDTRVQATSLFTLMRLAADGRGATLVPALAAAQASAMGLQLRPLAHGAAQRSIRLVYRRSFALGKALEAIAKACQQLAKALPPY